MRAETSALHCRTKLYVMDVFPARREKNVHACSVALHRGVVEHHHTFPPCSLLTHMP